MLATTLHKLPAGLAVGVAFGAAVAGVDLPAGAIIHIVVEKLILKFQQGGSSDLATAATMAGFTVMKTLNVALG